MRVLSVKHFISLALWFGVAVQAQPLAVYSEFRRVDPSGAILKQDATGDPREILSPAALRGMRLTYRFVVLTPPGERYWVYTGSNPENLIEAKLYKETFANGLPVGLEEREQPVTGTLSANQADSYVVDLFIPKNTEPRRIRFEIQLNFQSRWVIYPLEIRVLNGQLLDPEPQAPIRPAAATANAADPTRAVFQTLLCNAKPAASGNTTVAATNQLSLLARNAQQDGDLFRTAAARTRNREELANKVGAALGAADAKAWCADRSRAYDPDLFIRARDVLIRAALLSPE